MPENTEKKTLEEIQDWIASKVAEMMEISTDDVDISEPFANYGLSSVDAVSLSGDLEDWLQRRLSPTLLYDYPTIEEIAKHLTEELS